MWIYRIPRGFFRGGVSECGIMPAISSSGWEHNNFMIEIKRIQRDEQEK